MALRHRYECRVGSVDAEMKSIFTAVRNRDILTLKQQLSQGTVDLDSYDENGCTLLGLAAQHKSADFVDFLIDKGASVNAPDFYGQTALHFASEYDCTDVAATLIKAGANVDWMDVNNDGLSAIHIAACKGQSGVAKLLIKAGCNLNAQDIKGVSVLHCAVANDRYDIAKALLEAGARCNLTGSETSRTPLFLACELGNLKMAELLVNHGAKVNVRDNYGMTPLCAVCIQDNSKMAEFLIKAGTKVNIADNKQSLPIHYTARNSNVYLTEMLLDHGSEVDVINRYFEGPLHLAVRMGHMDVIKLLVDRGCNPNLHEPYGQVTPLHVAVDNYTEVPAFTELLELLLTSVNGCELDSRAYSSCETPLYRAVKQGNTKVALILVQHGANPCVPALDDSTPLQRAFERGQQHLVDAMLYSGAVTGGNCAWLKHVQFQIRPRLLPYFAKDEVGTVVNREQVLRDILKRKKQPDSLMRICRMSIRCSIGNKHLYTDIRLLTLPTRLKEFLMLKIM